MQWDLNGYNETKELIKTLHDPERIARDLHAYRREIGEDFTIEMLIKLYEIEARTKLAAAIYDLPEFTIDQTCKAFNSGATVHVSMHKED